MTTTETHTRSCRRCHGSGEEPPGPAYTEQEEKLLDQLSALGVQRAELQGRRAYMSTDGRAEYNKVVESIRHLVDIGEALGVRALDLQDAIGVSSAAYYKNFKP